MKTKKCRIPATSLVLVAFLVVAANVSAQSDRLAVFQSIFSDANLQTKLELLRSAEREDPGEFGPLYRQAINHVLDNSDRLRLEPMLREMAGIATDRIREGAYKQALPDLWRFFQVYDETSFRIQVLEVIGSVLPDTDAVGEELIDWVRRQHSVSQAGGRPDLQVLATAVATLGRLEDPRAYTVLLDTVLFQYPGFVTEPARASLNRLDGDNLEFALNAIRNRPLLERRSVFNLLLREGNLGDQERLEMARAVLSDSLAATTADLMAQEEARQLRNTAARVIREGAYAPATPEVIRHFNQAVLEFERGRISSGPLLEAIATIGTMGNDEAGRRLTRYLDLVNVYTEEDRPYDTQIVLAVIGNLELLGYSGAYDSLFYTTFLENYPRRVRDRARQAAMSVVQ